MIEVIKQTPLYNFIGYCNNECSEKKVLDCGAGGENPPLRLFSSYGYKTTGIEIDEEQLNAAKIFSKKNQMNLGIINGDMRHLPFNDNQFDCAYSYNSIFHMKKDDIEKSIHELKRVIKPSGLLFVNFLSIDDFMHGQGKELGKDEFEELDLVIHSFHSDDEADQYFTDMILIRKEKRIVKREFEGQYINQVFIDYILQHNK
jgi:ubiquinone/menaquinone biosynthesis C-methylase UbiE